MCFVDSPRVFVFIEQRGGAGGGRGEPTHLGAPGTPGAAWWVALPSEPLSGTSLAQQVSSGPEKSPKRFAAFGHHLVLIFYEVKNKRKIAIGTGHYVNRLVPKNDIKLL